MTRPCAMSKTPWAASASTTTHSDDLKPDTAAATKTAPATDSRTSDVRGCSHDREQRIDGRDDNHHGWIEGTITVQPDEPWRTAPLRMPGALPQVVPRCASLVDKRRSSRQAAHAGPKLCRYGGYATTRSLTNADRRCGGRGVSGTAHQDAQIAGPDADGRKVAAEWLRWGGRLPRPRAVNTRNPGTSFAIDQPGGTTSASRRRCPQEPSGAELCIRRHET